ncbi:MAG: ATP-binding cassette domain-containing protein [Microbacteriaceae bacterium]
MSAVSPVSEADPGDTALEARLVVRRGSFELDAAVRVRRGEVLALLGPNGSGKSTLLAALAGLILPQSGTVSVSGRTLTRVGVPGARVAIAPERRSVGLLGQKPLLFPHLTALQNVAFGPRAAGMPSATAAQDARVWLHAVGLAGFEHRRPAALSGGQQQRVAIARALAARPEVLLLDEPLAALDVQTAALTRTLLREQLTRSGTTAILVTHDVLDAIVLADRVAILAGGRIVDEGPKARVLGAPRNQFIAALAGVNLVEGTVSAEGVGAGVGPTSQPAGAGWMPASISLAGGWRLVGRAAAGDLGEPGAAASAVFPPAAVRIERANPSGGGVPFGSAREEPLAMDRTNRWEAPIRSLEPSSGGIRVRTCLNDVAVVALLPPVEVARLGLEVGGRVWLSVPASEVEILPLEGGVGGSG